MIEIQDNGENNIYRVYEHNFDTFDKKMKRCINKCKRYGIDCSVKIVEEGVDNHNFGTEEKPYYIKVRYRDYEIEVESVAKVNGWKFVATIEHGKDGNVIRSINGNINIPLKYRTAKQWCDHCNSYRNRLDTYILYNEETNEFKQVGRNCLRDFTGGFDAIHIAESLQDIWGFLRSFEEEEDSGWDSYYSGGRYKPIYDVKTMLIVTKAIIDKYGYKSSSDWGDSTKSALLSNEDNIDEKSKYIAIKIGGDYRNPKYEYIDYGSAEDESYVNDALEWIKNQNTDSNDYLYNLQTITKRKHCERRDIGYLVSLLPTYQRWLDKENNIKREREVGKASEFVGNVGDKIEFDITESRLLTTYETQFGIVKIYKFVDGNNNIFTWKTNNFVDTEKAKRIKGSVKNHNDYKGVKQTELTRCKITY